VKDHFLWGIRGQWACQTCQSLPVVDTLNIITPPPMGKRSIVMSVSVCVCVYLSVRDNIFGISHPVFTKFLCMLSMALPQPSVLLWGRNNRPTLCTR